MKFRSFLPAVTWFITTIILLTMPGDDLPDAGIFNIPGLDKIVHLVMFFMLTVLFSLPFSVSGYYRNKIYSWFYKITALVIIYGIVMEFIQKYLANKRSFDEIDILFDSAGAIAGLFAVKLFYDKKIGPDRNRGRNQN